MGFRNEPILSLSGWARVEKEIDEYAADGETVDAHEVALEVLKGEGYCSCDFRDVVEMIEERVNQRAS